MELTNLICNGIKYVNILKIIKLTYHIIETHILLTIFALMKTAPIVLWFFFKKIRAYVKKWGSGGSVGVAGKLREGGTEENRPSLFLDFPSLCGPSPPAHIGSCH